MAILATLQAISAALLAIPTQTAAVVTALTNLEAFLKAAV